MRNFFAVFYIFLALLILNSCSKDATIVDPGPAIPKIEAIAPNPAYISQEVTILGKNFGDSRGAGYVDFNGVKAQLKTDFDSWTPTSIKVYVPAGAVSGMVTVYTTDNKHSNSVALEITANPDPAAPVIKSFEGVTLNEIGKPVTIVGEHFGDKQNGGVVKFKDAIAVDYEVWSDTKIVAVIPDDAPIEKVPVTVTARGKVSNSRDFTVTASTSLLTMKMIPHGMFKMGDDKDKWDASPAHDVVITNDFYMSETEITQKQWFEVMDHSNPTSEPGRGDANPVNQVTWFRAATFCNKLSAIEKRTPCYTFNKDSTEVSCDFSADGYRLPTEAEWEYACRAGTTADFAGDISNIGWTSNDNVASIRAVKKKEPNAFGLYDMHGNVFEWCWDWYGADYYSSSVAVDPKGPSSGEARIMRGGSYQDDPATCSSWKRESQSPTLYNYNWGFRIVRKK